MTIFGLSVPDFVALANWIGIGLAGLVAAAAVLWGKSRPPSRKPAEFELAGAIVDSKSIKLLAAALEALLLESTAVRHEREKDRAVGHMLIRSIEKTAGEIHELRREIGDLGREVARRN